MPNIIICSRRVAKASRGSESSESPKIGFPAFDGPRLIMYNLQKQERLRQAVEKGDIEDIKICLEMGAGINDIPWGQESLLMEAIRCNHKHVAEYLINAGIDVNYIYEKSDSPRGDTKNLRQATAREYAEFYDMPEIIEMIDAKRLQLQLTQ